MDTKLRNSSELPISHPIPFEDRNLQKSFEILSIDLWSEDVDIHNRKNHKTKLRNILSKTHLCFIFNLCDQILPISRWYWNKCIGQIRSVSWWNRLLNIRQSITDKRTRLEGGFFLQFEQQLVVEWSIDTEFSAEGRARRVVKSCYGSSEQAVIIEMN